MRLAAFAALMAQMESKGGLKPPTYVDTDAGLDDLVASLRDTSMIAVDTEANPLFAYREKLCLIQISTRAEDFIVDPLSGIDLAKLVCVFADPSIVKVFHDAEFDMLMLKKTLPIEVVGIFDTKVAAMSLKMESIGLAAILQEFFDVTLDKKYQRSDWGRRPLSEAQLDYARYDTHFLLPLADDFRERLFEAGEIHQLEVAAEFRRLEDLVPEIRPFNPDDFTRIKGWDKLDATARRMLRELFVMRHELADDLDRPAFKVLPNDVLLRLATEQPADDSALKESRVMAAKLRERFGEDVLKALRRGAKLGPLPEGKIHRTRNEQDALSDDQRDVHEQLRNWRKNAAAARGVDASLVMPKGMMLAMSRLRKRPQDVDALRRCGVMEPWRVAHYGEGLVEALHAPSTKRRRAEATTGETRRRSRRS